MNSEYWKERKDLVKEIDNPLGTTESLYNACKAFIKIYDKELANEEATNIKNINDLINYYYVTISSEFDGKAVIRDKNKDTSVCKALLSDLKEVYDVYDTQASINIAKQLINKLMNVYKQIGCDEKYLMSFSSAFHRTKDGSIGYTIRTIIQLLEVDKENNDSFIMEADAKLVEEIAEASGDCMGMFNFS